MSKICNILHGPNIVYVIETLVISSSDILEKEVNDIIMK